MNHVRTLRMLTRNGIELTKYTKRTEELKAFGGGGDRRTELCITMYGEGARLIAGPGLDRSYLSV